MVDERTRHAVEELARVVRMNCGGSRAAATVLLYAYNSDHPIRDLYVIDPNFFEDALVVLRASYDPSIFKGGSLIPELSGLDMQAVGERYGVDGWHWK